MSFVSLPKGNLYYEAHGAGPAVVLIRGLGRWSEHWCGWHERLTSQFRVIVMDGRGLGRSTLPAHLWDSMHDLASDVKAVLEQEKIEKAHILGVSLGGMIAIQFGLDFPDSTLSVTAINSSVGRSGHLRMSVAAAQVVLSAPTKGSDFYPRLAAVLLSSNTSEGNRLKLANSWKEIDSKYSAPFRTVSVQIAIALRWRKWEEFKNLRCPVHIILGEEDQFVPRGNSLFIASKIPNAVLTKIPGAGHEIHLDQPDGLTNAVVEFYKKCR